MPCYDFNAKCPTEKTAIDYVFQAPYHNFLTCPHRGVKVNVYKDRKRAKVCSYNRYCNNFFLPFSNTMFEQSSTDMRRWFYTTHLVLNGKKGISGCLLRMEHLQNSLADAQDHPSGDEKC
jgi:hypothetical protein